MSDFFYTHKCPYLQMGSAGHSRIFGPQYGTCFMSLFLRQEFWGGS